MMSLQQLMFGNKLGIKKNFLFTLKSIAKKQFQIEATCLM